MCRTTVAELTAKVPQAQLTRGGVEDGLAHDTVSAPCRHRCAGPVNRAGALRLDRNVESGTSLASRQARAGWCRSLRAAADHSGLRDEAAAEIGREQPRCLHELIGHDYGDGFRGQQANEN